MTETNPLLRKHEWTAYPEITAAHVLPAVATRIAEYRARIDALVADPATHCFETLMLAWEECEDALNQCFAPVGHLHNVCDTPELRVVYTEALEQLTDFVPTSASMPGCTRRCVQSARAKISPPCPRSHRSSLTTHCSISSWRV